MWAVITVSSLIALIILVLSIPLDMIFHVDVDGRPKLGMRLGWLFGLVSKEVGKGRKKPEEKKSLIEDKRKHEERIITARTIFEILRIEGLIKNLKTLFKDILGHIRVRELRAYFRVGLDDPADTALLFGPVAAIATFLDSSYAYDIALQPSFDGEAVFEGYLHGAVRLQPIQLIAPIARFAFSLSTVRAVKILVMAKWKKKK